MLPARRYLISLTNAMDSAKFRSRGRAPVEEATGVFRRPPGLGSAGRDRRDVRGRAERMAVPRPAAAEAEADDVPEVRVESLRGSEHGKLTYDAKGNPVWEWRANAPRRRQDDSTIDMLKCLDSETLTLAEDPDEDRGQGFNPYDTAGDRTRK